MDKYFIAFCPEKKLCDLINKQKGIIRKLAGEQTYLSHPPHTTVIVFTTNNLRSIETVLERTAHGFDKIPIKIGSFHVFYDDPFTKGHTITYSLGRDSINAMKDAQIKIVSAIDGFNTRRALPKNSEAYGKLGVIEKANVDRYGFPFIGDNWMPHLTLASIDKNKFDKLFETLKMNQINGDFFLDNLALYKTGNPPSLIRKFTMPKSSLGRFKND